MKFALLSESLPPLWSGQAVVLKRLLEALDPRDYCLIARHNFEAECAAAPDCLPAQYYRLPFDLMLRGGRFGFSRWHTPSVLEFASKRRGEKLAHILRREECQAVVACTDSLLDIPAGFYASQLVGAAFYAYIFDDYSRKWIPENERVFAAQVEPRALGGARGIIVPNEFMRDELHRRYGVAPRVIHNPCDLTPYRSPVEAAPADEHAESLTRQKANAASNEFKLVYTGAIYDAHYDSFVRLLAALESLPAERPARLHVYTGDKVERLVANGLRGRVEFHEHIAPHESPRVQRTADALFLALAFDSPYPEVIRTSAPGKLGEYLAAGRPVLVHAPPDSFLAWYFRRYDCGLVIDQPDAARLKEGIERLRVNPDLCARLSSRARERAEADFSIEVARARFGEMMKLEPLESTLNL